MATRRLAPEAFADVQAPAVRSNWPVYDKEAIAEVCRILRSGKVNALHHGEQCAAFEQAFAKLCDVPFAVAVSNGTVALEMALRALQVGPGDEVIVPARSFMASASCVCAVGATPIFADVDADTQALNADTVSRVISNRTRAIIVVHLAGWPAAMEELIALANRKGIRVIEDCAQAHGATLNGQPVGSFGDIAAFSFCTDKIISTGGEGGMIVTRHADLWRRAWAYKDHGKTPESMMRPGAPGAFRWLHDSLGSNCRLTEMQAAIGLRQLHCLPQSLAIRRRNALILDTALSRLPALRLTRPGPAVGHAYYKYYCFVRPRRLAPGWSRDRIMAELAERQIPCGSGSCPEIYRESAFLGSPSAPASRLPVARRLGETSLMFPVDPTLDVEAIAIMAAVLRATMIRATQ
jgi:dTDP-4-amino-4,6-dideoxygalactose transaminase